MSSSIIFLSAIQQPHFPSSSRCCAIVFLVLGTALVGGGVVVVVVVVWCWCGAGGVVLVWCGAAGGGVVLVVVRQHNKNNIIMITPAHCLHLHLRSSAGAAGDEHPPCLY
jgi:hypothetical protein